LLAVERLERRDLLAGDYEGCVVETQPDGQHVITGSCPALESGGGGSGGSSDPSGNGTGNDDWPWGNGSSSDGSNSEYGEDTSWMDDPFTGDCSAPLADGTYPHYCLHDGQIEYTGDYQDHDVDVDGHCAEPLADGTIPHSCFQDGQIVYPGEYQDANEFGSYEWPTDDNWWESGFETEDDGADYSGSFVGIGSDDMGVDGSGFGSTSQDPEWNEQWWNPWYNEEAPTDINDDGQTSPQDALMLVNELNSYGSYELNLPAQSDGEGESAATRYLDANRDRWLSPADVLTVVNRLNSVWSATAGEGESRAVNDGHSIADNNVSLLSETSNRDAATRDAAAEIRQASAVEPTPGPPSPAISADTVAAVWEEIGRNPNTFTELDDSLLSLLAGD
jgi:hypothetical protein